MKPWGSQKGLIFLIFALNVLLGICLSGIFGSSVIVIQLYSSLRSFHIFHLDSTITTIFAIGIMNIDEKDILVLLMSYESPNCPTAATKLIRIINELITWSKSHILKNLLGKPSANIQNIIILESRNQMKERFSVFIVFAICGSSTVEPTLAEMRHFR